MKHIEDCLYHNPYSCWCEKAKTMVVGYQICEDCPMYRSRINQMQEDLRKNASIMGLLEDLK